MAVTLSETPATLYARLLIKFGGDVAGATSRQIIIKAALKQAAQLVWGFARWGFRHRVQGVATVVNQAYTTLPEDYARDADAGDWLAEATSRIERPVYVSPRDFTAQAALTPGASAPSPSIWTVGTEVITVGEETTVTPVIRWWPVPSAVKTYNGFQYYAAIRAFDETDTSTIFDDPRFDILWDMAATALCGKDLKPTEGVRIPGIHEVYGELELAKSKWAVNMATPIYTDNLWDSDDLSVTFTTGSVNRDASGAILMG